MMEVREEEITDETLKKYESCLVGPIKVHVMIQPFQQILPKGYVTDKYFERVENFTIYEDDVGIATYQKSGTTWMQELVWCLRNNLEFENQTVDIPDRMPFLEICSMHYGSVDTISKAENIKRPRILKTHLSFDMLPKDLRNGKAKIINVHRNPRDVCLSYLNHIKLFGGYTGSLDTVVDLFTQDVGPHYCPFFKNVLSYWDRRHLSNLLVLSYEEMQMDLPSVIKKVANFIDVKIKEEDIPKLCDHLSFDKMKNNDMVNYRSRVAEVQQKSNTHHEGSFINKGKTGNWKNGLTDEMIKKFQRWEEKWMKDSDLKFIYEL